MGTLRDLGRQLEEATAKRQGQVLPTENTVSGFYGAMLKAIGKERTDASQAAMQDVWRTVFRAIMVEYPDVGSAAIRNFLDSDGGRELSYRMDDAMSWNTTKLTDDARRAASEILPSNYFGKWMAGELAKFAAAAPAGQLGTTEGLVRKATEVAQAAETVQDEERKKNWKEREAAVHVLMKAADDLLTSARAWFAQKR